MNNASYQSSNGGDDVTAQQHAFLLELDQREKIDEMDAALASLEAKASQVHANSKVKADQFIADLKKRHDIVQATAKKQAAEGEAAWQRTKTQLESQWHGFEAEVKTYFDTFGKQIEQQQATFRDVAAAQVKAWREAADTLHQEATKVAAAKRADVDAAVKQMKADAAQAEAHFQKLKQAGKESLDGAERGLDEVAQGVRSGKSAGVGRTQARFLSPLLRSDFDPSL